jgi:hypothetical protein
MNLSRYADRFDHVTSEMLLALLRLRGTPPPLSACARRMAEILERVELEDQAADWWRCAARLGDREAQDYVAAFIEVTVSAPAMSGCAGSRSPVSRANRRQAPDRRRGSWADTGTAARICAPVRNDPLPTPELRSC